MRLSPEGRYVAYNPRLEVLLTRHTAYLGATRCPRCRGDRLFVRLGSHGRLRTTLTDHPSCLVQGPEYIISVIEAEYSLSGRRGLVRHHIVTMWRPYIRGDL